MLARLRARTPLLFCIMVVIVGIFVSGSLGLYARWEHFDTFMHALGGLGVAWFILAFLEDDILQLARWKQTLLIVACAALAGILWEFAEYLAGFGRDIVPWLWRWFHGGDLTDTMLDLAADLIGALTLSLWMLGKERRD